MSILGLAICLYAARSSINPITDTLTPQHALISAETTVNELTLNSTYKSFVKQPDAGCFGLPGCSVVVEL